MNYPWHIVVRKQISALSNRFLSFFFQKKSQHTHIHSEQITNILIIRPNYRIGNLLFLTPLINELGRQLPEAKIDIIVGMKLAGDILQPLPNVERVIDIPRKLLLHPLKLMRYIQQTRQKNYDITLNISGGSTSSQIVSALVRSKHKASFADKRLWADFDLVQERGKITHVHMGLEALEFLRFFHLPVPQQRPTLDIKLSADEIHQAKQELHDLLERNNIPKNHKTITIFRNARFDKKIADTWWSELIDAIHTLDQEITFIDILSPDITQKLNHQVLQYSNKNLRVLGAFFAACDLYISADTGPMHLAVAAQAKVLALFNKTNVEVYGALGQGNTTIEIEKLSPSEAAAITVALVHAS